MEGTSHGLTLVAMVVLLSGCAGGPGRKEVTRLQSQLGLLEERVTQLERADMGAGMAVSLLSQPAAVAESTPELAVQPERASLASQAPAAKSSLKPSTREIQQALKNAGFYQGAIDGKMGPLTRQAIKEFQRVHGLTDDGIVGKQTWAKLSAYQDLSSGSGELSAAEVLK